MKRLNLVIAALAAMVSLPVMAASSASASLGPITVTLFDLDPFDAIAPSITFAGPGMGSDSYVNTWASEAIPSGGSNSPLGGGAPWAPVSTSDTAGGASASASISGPGMASLTSVSASGSAADVFGPPTNNAQYYGVAHPMLGYSSFALTAKTLLIISAPASIAAAASGPAGYYSHYASADVYLSLHGPGASGGGSQSSVDQLAYTNYAYNSSFSHTDSRLLGASFVNLTTGPLSGYLYNYSAVYGLTSAPVPEPGTYAMLLAGLGLVGSMVRRRRS